MTGIAGPINAAELHRLSAYHRGASPEHARLVRDWPGSMRAPKPPQFKAYPGAEQIALPMSLPSSGVAVVDALRSLAFGGTAPQAAALDAVGLARLLFFAGGVTRFTEEDSNGKGRWFRAAGSSHNTSPLELYVVCGDLPGIAAGVHHYASVEHRLHVVRRGDHRDRLAEALARTDSPAAYVVITGVPWRSAWKYAERSFRNMYQDAGTMLAQMLAIGASSAQTGGEVRLGFVDALVAELLDLDGVAEFPLAVVPIGPPVDAAAPRTSLGPAAHGELGDRIAFPLVTEAQRAGDLARPGDVHAWCLRVSDRVGNAARATDATGNARDTPTTMTVERAIQHRGSTRRFARATANAAIFHWGVLSATSALPADFVARRDTLLEHLVVVHDVDGVAGGVYRAAAGAITRVRVGEMRAVAQELSIGQALASDGALVVYHCGSITSATAALGERGYRALALEVGTASGRLQLAASALGLGASGLVFYEGELEATLGASADGHLATAIGVPAYRARPGGTPGRPTQIRIPRK